MSACSSAGVMVAPCWIIWSISALASAALEARNCCAGALEWHEPQRASMIAVGFEPGDGPEDESAVDDVAAGPEPFCWSASDCWNPARSCCFSAALSFALGCSSVNCSGGMPPLQFTLLHPSAKLSAAEKQQLLAGFQQSLADQQNGSGPAATSSTADSSSGPSPGSNPTAIIDARCGSCHSSAPAQQFRASSAAEAKALIDQMIQQGATITPAEEQALIKYYTS